MPLDQIYERIAPLYDVLYGTMLQPGRRRAMTRLAPRPGETILEVGVGTGFGLTEYPAGCSVLAIDLSLPMLTRARARVRRVTSSTVMLCQMDAARLALPDASVDAVYAPYLINVVSDGVVVANEVVGGCRGE